MFNVIIVFKYTKNIYFVRRLRAGYQSWISYHIVRNCVSVHKDNLLKNVRTDMFYSLIALEKKPNFTAANADGQTP